MRVVASPVVILSPHFDDAVLSCWHLLTGPGDVRVVNVFAGVPPAGGSAGWWDRLSGRGDSRDLVRERIAEDRSALALAGREPVNLGFLDRQYRAGEQPIEPLIVALLAELPRDAVVVAPAAFAPRPDHPSAPDDLRGPHPDHVTVRTAALALRSEGFAVALYADLPHASAGGWPEWVAAAVVPDGLTADVRRLTPQAFSGKLRAVRCYASQVVVIEDRFGLRLDDPGLLGDEVVWWPPASDYDRARAPASSSASAAPRKRSASA